MKSEDGKSNGGLLSPESELQPLLQRLDALAAMIGSLAESNAALAAAVVDLIAAEREDDEGPQEPEDETRGGYLG